MQKFVRKIGQVGSLSSKNKRERDENYSFLKPFFPFKNQRAILSLLLFTTCLVLKDEDPSVVPHMSNICKVIKIILITFCLSVL